ncbi:MAG: hypothetical protein HUU17_05890 [Chthonomonadales bacterium]|nr:hypothetical protein [Chthonomonadales bacterium]
MTGLSINLTRFCFALLFALASAIGCAVSGPAAGLGQERPPAPSQSEDDRYIVLSEFQVWADAATPEVFKELSRLYNAKKRSHVFDLYPRYDLFVWDVARMRGWVDEARSLGCFNLFCIGDDTRTAEGHLFDSKGVNPKLKGVLFDTIAYAHEQGMMAAVEPTNLPPLRDKASFVPWLRSWIGPDVPEKSRADIIKLSIEWFGAWAPNPEIALEVEAFFDAVQEVSPGTLVYVDSIGGLWRQPLAFHRWLLRRFPGVILSHYLNTDQVPAFRAIGARNLMVQVNPSEKFEEAGQFFIYHDFTVQLLKDAVAQRLRFLSLAGVNMGYSRYNYDLFLDVIRPHLKLAHSVQELRASVDRTVPADGPGPDEVAADLVALARSRAEEALKKESPPPLNSAGRPVCFAQTPDGWVFGVSRIVDGKNADKFQGAYTAPVRRRPVRATFGLDFGAPKDVRSITFTPCFAETEAGYVATECGLDYRVGETWKPIPGAEWRKNDQRRITFALQTPLRCDGVRLIIRSQTSDGRGNYRAACQEIEVREE